ncbi:helix-turn-helix transcriptional regulator [Nocardiopsis sp. NPDC006139]|jgi:transcriptional regulator with XRE-family HTH domain|uniref:helix-turn-helix domain-containing protein n=1 Tax=Nocardiopsis sp. NPDC006139 TaxID=3154578 RepID=UPI0033A39AB8
MSEKPTPTREGELIRTSLIRIGLSARQAAKQSGISEGRWRQIVNGYQIVTKGTYVPVRGPADTVAAMARTVGVTEDQLIEAGREDAAEKLSELSSLPDASPEGLPGWDAEIIGPDGPVAEGEELRWRDEKDARTFELTVSGVSFEGTLGTDVSPEEALPKLRRMMALRMAQANAALAERLHTLG